MDQPVVADINQEVRLAVVMYGGVSLAIYINGIAQEMLRLVRSTALNADGTPRISDGAIAGTTEEVYRRLGRFAGRPSDETSRTSASYTSADPIHTRFVIDVISGTSAGGINGIFLGKALANAVTLDKLKQLWIDEGDIQVLINDKQSAEAPLRAQDPPESLLNSRRMYAKLLEAFEGMQRADDVKGGYVEELDVFSTTTDIDGAVVSLRLADKLAYERRHRNVFHFQYLDGVANDFEPCNDPFLAFAARCTSSFPFAFEPMCLHDIDDVRSSCRGENGDWKQFFDQYRNLIGGDRDVPLSDRAFGDGGYLDNKPFSYAADCLVKRHAGTRVERKLFYIEPSPEHPENAPASLHKPDALANSLAALVEIPGYETIRGDLQRVLEHNRDMERVKRILSQVESDLEEAARRSEEDNWKRSAAPALKAGEWSTLDLVEMFRLRGRAYVAYNRLKTSAVTDDIVSMLAPVFGFDDDPALFQATRCLLRAWRDATYVQYHEDDKPTQNQFLMDFDLSYRLRRLRFVMNKADDLARLDESAETMLRFRKQDAWLSGPPADVAPRRAAFRNEIRRVKQDLLTAYERLRAIERQLWPARASGSNVMAGFTEGLTITQEDLRGLLGEDRARELGRALSEVECTRLAVDFLNRRPEEKQQMDLIAERLRAYLRESLDKDQARPSWSAAPDGSPEAAAARNTIRHYFDHFEDYDQVLFPILFQTDVLGEGAAVDVIRISPEDATCLDECEAGQQPPKLAGVALGHFGAFMDREWRRNDMMWGRLDAAERLITAMLPGARDEKERRLLIDQAHRVIIREELGQYRCTKLYDAYTRSELGAGEVAIANQLLGDEKLQLQYYRKTLVREPDPKASVRALARGTQVIGRMLQHIADQRHMDTKRVAVVTQLGRAFWGLVEVAVPRSLPQLFFHYWLRMLYVFALLLIAAGLVGGSSDALKTGWLVLAAVGATHLAAALLADFMRSSRSVFKSLIGGLAVLFVALAATGAYTLYGAMQHAGVTLHRPEHPWLAALGALSAIAVFCGVWARMHARDLERVSASPRQPALAMEIPASAADIGAVLGNARCINRAIVREMHQADLWFIGACWLLFGGLSFLMFRYGESMLPAAVATFTFASAAAVLDILLGNRIQRFVEARSEIQDGAEVKRLRRTGQAKWACFSLALLLVTPLFFMRGGWLTLPGAWFAATALVGLAGVWNRRVLAVATAMMSAGLLILTVLLLARAEWFINT